MIQLQITYDERDLKKLVLEDLRQKLGNITVDEGSVEILVKSKQNYKSEWERADFMAKYVYTK